MNIHTTGCTKCGTCHCGVAAGFRNTHSRSCRETCLECSMLPTPLVTLEQLGRYMNRMNREHPSEMERELIAHQEGLTLALRNPIPIESENTIIGHKWKFGARIMIEWGETFYLSGTMPYGILRAELALSDDDGLLDWPEGVNDNANLV